MTILVALDFRPISDDLLASARAVAAVANWSLRVLHVDEPGDPPPSGWPSLRGAGLTRMRGDAGEEILRAADDPAVSVLALGLRSEGEAGIGHVAHHVLEHAACMLLVVRPGMRVPDRLRRIVVPLEGSPSTSAAMRVVDEVFCARGREIVMVHVVTGDTPVEPGSMPAPRFMDQEHHEWVAWQEEFCRRFSPCSKGGRHRVAVRVGEPGATIIDEAREAQAELLVASWRGNLAHQHAASLKQLLEASPCPLLLVSPSAA